MQVINSSVSTVRRALGTRRGQVIVAAVAALVLFAIRAREVVSGMPEKAKSVAAGASVQVRSQLGQESSDEAPATQSVATSMSNPSTAETPESNGAKSTTRATNQPASEPSAGTDTLNGIEGDGSHDCPDGYPIKGNASSHIYHLPGEPHYDRTIPNFCFATEEDAAEAGYRPRSK